MSAAPLRCDRNARGGSRSRLSVFLPGLVALGVVAGVRDAGAQAEYVFELPGDLGETPEQFGEHVFEIEVDPSELQRATAAPPMYLDLGELSPNNPSSYAVGTILIRVRSPRGFFPEYQIEARARTAISAGVGDFTTQDVGMGVTNVVATNPVINPRFDYDPAVSPKNVDDEPIFEGTIATLPLRPPRLWLYRTQGFWMGEWNSFVLNFAVGPQFYSPTGATGTERLRVEIAVRRI